MGIIKADRRVIVGYRSVLFCTVSFMVSGVDAHSTFIVALLVQFSSVRCSNETRKVKLGAYAGLIT